MDSQAGGRTKGGLRLGGGMERLSAEAESLNGLGSSKGLGGSAC